MGSYSALFCMLCLLQTMYRELNIMFKNSLGTPNVGSPSISVAFAESVSARSYRQPCLLWVV